MSNLNLRPPVWVGHVVLESNRLGDSADFMLKVGMRPVFRGPEVAIFELRGGTHLILVAKQEVAERDAPFDLMVEDLRATHQHLTSLGLTPTAIESVPKIDHELFRIREPAGNLITFYSNHVSGRPV